jgi:hypothetical protein
VLCFLSSRDRGSVILLQVINEFGATRFDVAVRALRGELDPAPWVEVSKDEQRLHNSKVQPAAAQVPAKAVGAQVACCLLSMQNTERNPGVLMSKLINFPTAYTFQVGRITEQRPSLGKATLCKASLLCGQQDWHQQWQQEACSASGRCCTC